MLCDPGLRRGGSADAEACAAIYSAWVEATPWMPRVHSPEDLLEHYHKRVLAVCDVIVAEDRGRLIGFLSVDVEGFIAGFFVAEDMRSRGIGAALLGRAKTMRPHGLSLWTFEANHEARRFYARHGFREDGRSAGENDEGLPDIRLVWRAT